MISTMTTSKSKIGTMTKKPEHSGLLVIDKPQGVTSHDVAYVEFFDGHRTCLKFHILTFTRQIISALAVDLNGGVDVRYLFDAPGKPFCDQLFHSLTRGKARCPLPRQQLA